MEWLSMHQWEEIFMPDKPLLEIFVRGTVVYLTLFIMMRLLKREAGSIGISDLLVVVLIADAAQNAMAGEYTSVSDGVFLVATLMFWDYALDWIACHSQRVRRFIFPPPLPLIKNGRMVGRNMRQEMISRDELLSQLRQQGVEHVNQVKMAYMEGDGNISIIKYKDSN